MYVVMMVSLESIKENKVLFTSAPGTLFKDSKRRNYFIKKLNILISDALITHIFMPRGTG